MVDNGAAMGMWGLREINDVDVLGVEPGVKNLFKGTDVDIHWWRHHGAFHLTGEATPDSPSDFVYNPSSYAWASDFQVHIT